MTFDLQSTRPIGELRIFSLMLSILKTGSRWASDQLSTYISTESASMCLWVRNELDHTYDLHLPLVAAHD